MVAPATVRVWYRPSLPHRRAAGSPPCLYLLEHLPRVHGEDAGTALVRRSCTHAASSGPPHATVASRVTHHTYAGHLAVPSPRPGGGSCKNQHERVVRCLGCNSQSRGGHVPLRSCRALIQPQHAPEERKVRTNERHAISAFVIGLLIPYGEQIIPRQAEVTSDANNELHPLRGYVC
jgi:hypothetical protein